jgi:hypothetical protein
MPLNQIITGTQKRSKDSFASSPVVGLAVRSNGEESVKIIDARGNVYSAGIAAPTVAPTVADDGVGLLPNAKYAGYVYVYATSRFPFVESDLSVNGKLYPRSNASPVQVYQYTGAGSRKVAGTATKTTAAGVDKIWVFRTAFFATSIEAQTAAEGGFAFFVAEVANNGIAGLQNWTDNNPVSSADQIQNDNFAAPQFQFCVYFGVAFGLEGNAERIAGKKLAGLLSEAVFNIVQFGEVALLQTMTGVWMVPVSELTSFESL